jgi:hypothetical protein
MYDVLILIYFPGSGQLLTKSKGYYLALVRAPGAYLVAAFRILAAAYLAACAAIFAGRHCLPGNGLFTYPLGNDITNREIAALPGAI